MANNKRDGNKSQFFITLGECSYLDNKHAVFGEVVDGINTLNKMNKVEAKERERPAEKIIIERIVVHENPYRNIVNDMRNKYRKRENKK